ncbi:hypothetical protein [Asticcacaulis sp. AND118]|uniref:hypothetical protein n=1 Tax=Asticcacaulis sp. AND118 TaxID=2840468 RepID=UPI001CFF8A24|nr:hypothetical protein [Asticcacaulis sp. AND118]UDF04064.1 hypothetical protein LH365_03180 [Asticcacaulis sp. AND118]
MIIPNHVGFSHIETRYVLDLGKGEELVCGSRDDLKAALKARGKNPKLAASALERDVLVTQPIDHLAPETNKALTIVALALSRHSHVTHPTYWHLPIELVMRMAVIAEPDYRHLKDYALPLAIHLLTKIGLTPYFDKDGDISAR